MLSFALYSIVGMAALFILPYYFPKKELVAVSASYDFGFNNSAGIMILFLLCLGLTVHAWLFRRKSYQNIITKHNADLHKIFGICLFLQIIFCLTVWFIMRYTYGMIEATYFITRIHELDIGRKLYSQTDFAYGALMLYIPLLIHRISGLSLQDAYFTSWTLMQCVGFYWFYCVISRFNIDKSAKKIIFIAIFIMTLPVSAGMNYVFFRFITPYMALLFLHDKEDMPPPPQSYILRILCYAIH